MRMQHNLGLAKINRYERGFTIVEAMIAVAVLSIVLGIAVPNFISLITTNKLIGDANSTLAALTLARSEAIKQNQSVLFCHSSDGESCSDAPETGWIGWLVRSSQDSLPIASGTFRSDLRVVSAEAISNSEFDGVANVIRFTPQGLARQGNANLPLNGDLSLCAQTEDALDNNRLIRISSGGRMRIVAFEGQTNCWVEDE
jgi:prepilin-type N-terminal cleavage/methylation domain